MPGVPLAPLTTLRIGGPAERLLEARSEAELVLAVREADAAGTDLFLLAGGSNVVIADAGVPGTTVRVLSRGVARRDAGDAVEITAQAGEPWDELVAGAVAEGLAGIECLAGIPGSVGATPIQNVGAYGQEVAATIVAVRALDRGSGEVIELAPEACGFGYRTSRFKRERGHLVLAVTYALRRSPDRLSEPIRYAQLAAALDVEPGARAPLAEVSAAVLALRRAKGMVLDPGDPDSLSAGSFFTNPVLGSERAAALARRAGAREPRAGAPPSWPQPDGSVKVSAAWLVEHAGFGRGYGTGRAGVSSRHSLALVNRGGATAAELVALARKIAAGVREAFGVELVPEPVFVGHDW